MHGSKGLVSLPFALTKTLFHPLYLLTCVPVFKENLAMSIQYQAHGLREMLVQWCCMRLHGRQQHHTEYGARILAASW